MKNYFNSSSRSVLFLILTVLLLYSGCSDDPSSPSEEKPVDAVTIGTGGGSIEKDGFKLTIPAGAFDGNYNISVGEIEDDGAFGENNISEIYKIEGLPDKFTSPLKVGIKYSGQLTGESYIAFGVENLENTVNDSAITYTLFQASDSVGYVIAELALNTNGSFPKISKIASANAYKYRGYLRAIHRMNTYNTDHFEIKYPRELENSKVLELATNLEEIHNIVSTDLNFRLDQLSEPILVSTQYRATYASRGFNNSINIGNNYIASGEFSKIRKSLGSELLGIGINIIFDPYERFGLNNPDYSWLEGAILSWSEELFTLDESFEYPLFFNLDYMSPFWGLRAGAGPDNTYLNETTYEHGIGMSSLIKYMIENDKFKKADIVKIFQDIAKGSKPTSALIQNVDGNVTEWWPDFFKKYIMGDIYNLSMNDFITEVENEWSINNTEDKEKIFSITESPDLSANLFKLNLNHSDFNETSNMLLQMTSSMNISDKLSIIMFGIQNEKIAYLGTSFGVDGLLKNLADYYYNDMKQFLVVLVNSNITSPNDYLGTSDIDFTIKIESQNGGGGSDLQYNLCRLEVYINGEFEDTRLAEGTIQENPISFTTYHEYWDFEDTVRTIAGSFNGNTFSGSYNSGDGRTQTATFVLNESRDMVIDYSWAEVDETWPDERTARGVNGQNIPVNVENNSLFELRGENACSGVSTTLYFRKMESDSVTLINYSCDENSRVVIQFYNDK